MRVEAEREPIGSPSLPKTKTDLPSTPDGKMAPANLWGHPQEREKRWRMRNGTASLTRRMGLGGGSWGRHYTDADEAVKIEAPQGGRLTDTRFYDALILAHVLPQPDFRSAPWRRRL